MLSVFFCFLPTPPRDRDGSPLPQANQMLVVRTDGEPQGSRRATGTCSCQGSTLAAVRRGHAGHQHSCGAACKSSANGVAHGGENGSKLVAASMGCGTGQRPEDPGGAFVLSTPARPNKRVVLDALQPKVVKVIAITIDFPKSHRVAAVVPGMNGMGSGDANGKCGGKGM